MRKQLGMLLLGILAVGAGSGLYWQGQGNGESVKAVRVSKTDFVQYEQGTGKVKPVEEQVYFTQASGKLLKLLVKQGDRVEKGQVLAELDLTEAELRLQQLEAQLEQVQAEWHKAKEGPKPEEVKLREENVKQARLKVEEVTRSLDRVRNQYDSGDVTAEQLRQKENEGKLAQSALEIANSQLSLLSYGPSAADQTKYEAKVKELQTQLELVQKELLHVRVTSGLSGTVVHVPIQEGQFVDRGRELFTVADLSRLELISEVKETLISKITINQHAVIKGSALGNEQYSGHVVKIAPMAKPSQTTTDKKPVVEVTLALDQGSALLLPGFQLDVFFEINKVASALQVPRSAVKQRTDGSSYVWTVEESKAVSRTIETGLKNEAYIEVKEGLKEDSLVIVKPPETLKERQRVIVDK